MEGYNSRYDPAHIGPAEALALAAENESAIVIDVRSAESFMERHVSTAVNVPFESVSEYAQANIPDKDRIVIFYCFCDDKGGAALSACNLLKELGYTNVYYTEPDDDWIYEGTSADSGASENGTAPGSGAAEDSDMRSVISGREAKEIYDSNPGAILLDVRNQDEYDEGHIDGSTLIPVAELEGRLQELPDKDAVIIVYCRSGRRSAAAFRLLSSSGYTNLYDMQSVSNWPG